ncbi:MAG: UDP-N-acetylmuramate dehydrogenase [Defluviitaleaceae bacterium]|nr:UDP-N-acetylmuramate dehydrogenase [Defluviitaleaceae bacterium]
MKKHTSFKIGGPAEVLARPKNTEEFIAVWQTSKQLDIPLTILGDGTNVLAPDEGIKGIVMLTNKMTALETRENGEIYAATGVRLAKLAEAACQASLAGLEFASGIPGTVGGAVFMNAGAYGGEIKDFCISVDLLGEDGAANVPASQMGFGYRSSNVQNSGQLILGATFKLSSGKQNDIRALMTDLNNRRKISQPLDFPSAGSTFKRPEGYYAGKLIQDSGLKGYTIGGAQVSEKHAGFVVNKGNATAHDVLELIASVRNIVHENHGVWLEPEIRIL